MRYYLHIFVCNILLMTQKNIVIVLAGGVGKRMQSDVPKVLHTICEKPMLVHVIEQARLINPEKIFIVVGKYKELIVSTLEQYISLNDIEFILQPEPLGTGNAIKCCKYRMADYQYKNVKVVVLSGDVPLIQNTTILNVVDSCLCNSACVVTTEFDNPYGYGRIIVSSDTGKFLKIVEEKDCNEIEKQIQKVNCGIYAFDVDILCKYIECLTNDNAQNEYYLTDILEIIKNINGNDVDIGIYNICKERQFEIMGVNTIEQLKELEVFAYKIKEKNISYKN